MTLYLHIGTYKTGTTSIQKYCTAQKDKLLNAGLRYITAGPKLAAANALAQAILSDNAPRLTRILNYIESQSGPGDRLLSAEQFGLLHPARLRDAAGPVLLRPGEEIVILCYLRRQDEFLEAMYLQRFYAGRISMSFAEYIRTGAEGMNANYKPLLDLWQATFPEAEIRVRPYQRAQLRDGDVVADFFELIGLSAHYDPALNSHHHNPSGNRDVYELIWLLANQTSLPVREICSYVLQQDLPATGAGRGLFTDPDRQQFLSRFAQANEALRTSYLPHAPHLFLPPDPQEVSQSTTSFTPEQLHLIGHLLRGIDQTPPRETGAEA